MDKPDLADGDAFRAIEAELEKEKTTPNSTKDTSTEGVGSDEQFLTGSKLYMVLFAVTLIAFLNTLDTSIVATVRQKILLLFCINHMFLIPTDVGMLGHPQDHQRIPFSHGRWLVWQRVPHRKVGPISFCRFTCTSDELR